MASFYFGHEFGVDNDERSVGTGYFNRDLALAQVSVTHSALSGMAELKFVRTKNLSIYGARLPSSVLTEAALAWLTERGYLIDDIGAPLKSFDDVNDGNLVWDFTLDLPAYGYKKRDPLRRFEINLDEDGDGVGLVFRGQEGHDFGALMPVTDLDQIMLAWLHNLGIIED